MIHSHIAGKWILDVCTRDQRAAREKLFTCKYKKEISMKYLNQVTLSVKKDKFERIPVSNKNSNRIDRILLRSCHLQFFFISSTSPLEDIDVANVEI